ncbi:hypothetical protein BBO99_00007692 [Phytophthora kernoviae]|uniref:BZIP domain-containing protein n=2 Tax=Phytophthora kernoviae TaxID=325452 RepID=A0A421FLL4_9STRA|nr:hypothetical protein G195_008301 [Phytophthora kernoviae 00238/432]KAG2518237.1 hypothetical protein JM16_007365 [Phytophthora kernoviae]KAG2520084.1 hypothetical protein JM18_007260 [Phytophthora kernoviae]RLN46578.1 hypothetical protein BBI17_007611 [Phytophthora kernoviae]RLN76272.1 hypothetical protein BBO99_00007692 [Phytophthora kernoviae]
MGDQQDKATDRDTPTRNPSSPAAMSGIDWSIFKDGEEDAFGWLLRNNSSGAVSSSVGKSISGAGSLTSDILPLDDLEVDRMMAATMGPQLQMKGQVAASAALGNAAYGASQSNARLLAAQLYEVAGAEEDQEKKQLRRVKNLVSVREFRKRKMKQLEQNEARLRRLEAENMDLKMRLKIGKEAILSEQREKKQIKEQMREMLQRNATEQEIAQFLNMYKITYSDYGPKRREKLHFHLSRIRELLLPTQVTKLSLYSVEQGIDMLKRDHVIKEDPMSAPESATATMSLWGILADELEVSDEQQRQILERRVAITKVRDDLNHTLNIVKQLEEVTDEKNTALEAQVAQLQHILTPSQATKFIIWVKENPAFMYMLDKLVDSTLQSTGNTEE